MSYVSAVVVAAGKGSRFKYSVPKPLVKINAKPAIVYSLETLSRHPAIKEIIVVTNAQNRRSVNYAIRKYRILKVSAVIGGGRRRQDSVYNGLRSLGRKTDIVLIHDGARPFIDSGIISRSIEKAISSGAAIIAVPVKDTVKEVTKSQRYKVTKDILVKKTLNRDTLWEVQTPQVFRKRLILRAYERFRKCDVTDDAMLVEKLGAPVKVVEGSYNNIKITTIEDLIIAEAIARERG
ncbi:MAG: 2-C-methyl-D-erythritol 4-phosphate cytidylyltransferase [Candidatus Omnitrophota bacterium]